MSIQRVRNDEAWVQTLPLTRITADVVFCVICEHAVSDALHCIVAGCEDQGKRVHKHCKDDCFCTVGGCMPRRNDAVTLPRGFL